MLALTILQRLATRTAAVWILLAGLAFVACARSNPAGGLPTPERLSLHRADVLIEGMDPRMREALQDEPWLADDEATVSLVQGIAMADASYRQASRDRTDLVHPAAILTAARSEAWYAEGLDASTKSLLNAVFRSYAGGMEDSRSPDLAPALVETLRENRYAYVALPGGARRLVVVAALDGDSASRALGAIDEYLPALDRFAGPMPASDPDYLTVVVAPGFQPCLARPASFAIFLGPSCLTADGVMHEVAHIYFGGCYPDWFTEGIAVFLAEYVTGRLDSYYDAVERSPVAADGNGLIREASCLSGEPRDYEALAGFVFLKATDDILGDDRMQAFVQSVRGQQHSGQELLDALLAQAPKDRRPELEALIAASFQQGR